MDAAVKIAFLSAFRMESHDATGTIETTDRPPRPKERGRAERGMLRRGSDKFATVVKIFGQSKRVYVLTAAIIDGGGDEG